MWFKDDGGADMKGSVDVQDREGNIEIIGLSHSINLPVDGAKGNITGTHQHSSMMIENEVDSSTHTFIKPQLQANLEKRRNSFLSHK